MEVGDVKWHYGFCIHKTCMKSENMNCNFCSLLVLAEISKYGLGKVKFGMRN